MKMNHRIFGSVILFGSILISCAGRQTPIASVAPTEQVMPEIAPPPPPLPKPAIREVRPTIQSQVRVVKPQADPTQPKTLIEASRLAKKTKEANPTRPVLEINDGNLSELAKGADVFLLESDTLEQEALAKPAAAPAEAVVDLAPAEPQRDVAVDERDEESWRNRALELRMGLRRGIDEIAKLELEAASLRQQFYAEEDPYFRDSQIKPGWDRVLDRLEAQRQRVRRTTTELQAFLNEGQQMSVPQGWLNQGWELEPTEDERKRFAPAKETLGSSSAVEPISGAEPIEPRSREPIPARDSDNL
jgi:hypothetical protein